MTKKTMHKGRRSSSEEEAPRPAPPWRKFEEAKAARDDLRAQNISLVRKSVELSAVKRELEDKNFELEQARKELRKENVALVRKSLELSDVMRQLEDRNYDLELSQKDLEDALANLNASQKKTAESLRREQEARRLAEESEAKFKALYETTTDAVVIVGKDSLIDCNDATLHLFGYETREEFLATDPAEFAPPTQPDGSNSVEMAGKHTRDALKGNTLLLDWTYWRKDHSEFQAEILLNSMVLQGQTVLQVVIRDITERRAVEEELALHRQHLEELVNERTSQLRAANQDLSREIAARKKTERELQLNEARLEALLALSQMTEASLQELTDFALAKAVSLTESEIGYVAFVNEDETLLTLYAWSEAANEMCDIDEKPLVYPLESVGLWGEPLRQRKPVITNDYTGPNPQKRGYPQGHVHIVRYMGVPVFDGERIVASAGVANKREGYNESDVRQTTLLMDGVWQIIQRKKREEALRASEERFRHVIEHSPLPILMADQEEHIEYLNPKFMEVIGYSRDEIPTIIDWWRHACPDEATRIRVMRGWREAFAKARSEASGMKPVEYDITCKDGVVRTMEASGAPVGDKSLLVLWDTTERKRAQEALAEAHRDLVETARRAGMAEVATGVLHNVGNVLNSIGVTTTSMTRLIENSSTSYLNNIADMMNQHKERLGTFITQDDRGSRLPAFIDELAEKTAEEQQSLLEGMKKLGGYVRHITDVIGLQQSYSKNSGMTEPIQLSELMEDAARINDQALVRHGIRVRREYAPLPSACVERARVLQILTNLISNAKHSLATSGRDDPQLTLRIRQPAGAMVRLEVEDNGLGITREDITRVFGFGFTTRSDGHGFGLHSGALAAKEMGGSLTVRSEGEGKGATFVLELPYVTKDGRTS